MNKLLTPRLNTPFSTTFLMAGRHWLSDCAARITVLNLVLLITSRPWWSLVPVSFLAQLSSAVPMCDLWNLLIMLLMIELTCIFCEFVFKMHEQDIIHHESKVFELYFLSSSKYGGKCQECWKQQVNRSAAIPLQAECCRCYRRQWLQSMWDRCL